MMDKFNIVEILLVKLNQVSKQDLKKLTYDWLK